MTISTNTLLSCLEFRDFWVEWIDSTLTFGSGKYRGHVVLSYTNTNVTFDVASLSLSTYYDVTGHWHFLQEQGKPLKHIM